MTWQNIILLISGLVNLTMSIIVFSRGIKNKVNLYFGLLTFSNFLWAGSLFLGKISDVYFIWYYLGAIFAYAAALWIIVSLYYFSLHFPAVVIRKNKSVWDYLIILFSIFLCVIIYIDNLFILGYDKNILLQEYTLFVNKPVYLVYSLYFVVVALFVVYNFYNKQKILEGLLKKRMQFLFFTIIFGLLIGVYFDLVICYFANYKYSWVGPAATFFMNSYVFYLIFHTKDK